MATQVFTNFEGQSKSEFDTISVKTINLENYCGSYKLDASAFCQLQDKVSEAYCKAVSAFEEAEKAYCAASGSGSSSDYCGSDYCSSDYCGSGSSGSSSSSIPIVAYSADYSWTPFEACCPPPSDGALALGFCSLSKASYAISIGTNAWADGCAVGSIVIGRDSSTYCKFSISIGVDADSAADNSIVIGTGATNNIRNSTSIFAGVNSPHYNTFLGVDTKTAVRFTQVAGCSLDNTKYIFQHITGGYIEGSAQGVIISATNFFNLLKSAGGVDYNVLPSKETFDSLPSDSCSSTYCADYCGDYCSSDYCSYYCSSDYCSSTYCSDYYC